MHRRTAFLPSSSPALISRAARPFFSNLTLSGKSEEARRMALRACSRYILLSSLAEMLLMDSLVERLFSLRSVSKASRRTPARKVSTVVRVSFGQPKMNVTTPLSRSASWRRAFTGVMVFLFLAASMAFHCLFTRA